MLPLPQRLPASLRTISAQAGRHIGLQSMVCANRRTALARTARPAERKWDRDGRYAEKTPGFRKIMGVFSPQIPHFSILPRRSVSFAPDFGLQQVPNEMLSARGWHRSPNTPFELPENKTTFRAL